MIMTKAKAAMVMAGNRRELFEEKAVAAKAAWLAEEEGVAMAMAKAVMAKAAWLAAERAVEEAVEEADKATEEAAWGEVLAADQAMTVALWKAAEKKAAR